MQRGFFQLDLLLICLYVLFVSIVSAASVIAMTEAHKRDMAVDNK